MRRRREGGEEEEEVGRNKTRNFDFPHKMFVTVPGNGKI